MYDFIFNQEHRTLGVIILIAVFVLGGMVVLSTLILVFFPKVGERQRRNRLAARKREERWIRDQFRR